MILDTIVAQKKREVAALKKRGLRPPGEVDPPRGFQQALTSYAGIALIAEAKKASPSKGVICEDFRPVEIARRYEVGGAQCLSVLTDENFFQGHLDYLSQVRKAVGLPVLRKDFTIDQMQIQEARAHGADAILLIAAILSQSQMVEFLAQARELGMDVLVEVHDERELERALAINSPLIGINNRNLNDFSVDLGTTLRLKKEIPAHIPVVSESGIRDGADIRRLAEHDICAVLVGESLMRAGGRDVFLRDLMGRS
ncbi:MAG: indole-3-glycerol phosphate synthase TrpC [Deltaproteobacteria bacterium]|jgi:indole-3-glycerol phosphate synthase|nr:indole-3-glycerol phosphate synthase TrpC [Deltaproteobacteria bacterium]